MFIDTAVVQDTHEESYREDQAGTLGEASNADGGRDSGLDEELYDNNGTFEPVVDSPNGNNDATPAVNKVTPAMDAHTIDMAILDKRLYPLLKELLDAGKMNTIRRNILTLILSSVKVLFSKEISKWMSEQSRDAVSHRTTAVTLQWLIGAVWPGGRLIQGGLVQSEAQDALMRERNLEFLASKLANSYVAAGQVFYII